MIYHDVLVTHDHDAGVFTAVNDDLGLVVEAETYDAVVAAAQDIAPDLADLNMAPHAGKDLRLRFIKNDNFISA